MATMFYDKDADIQLIRKRKVAVIGYGSRATAMANFALMVHDPDWRGAGPREERR